ncbi:hypothetical protein CDG76_15600 [Nostoc sp. 'Peltigera membranacea cyanobiont' 210A]|uniref:hypothetical protein n=1 Tax=Nostoc sp. 'Peltigera membranacea cyanobiont' 210A TaxID=2014529 RepID=UPI000B951772|nr:hypothetical protein [Nostoc sp. 'Peltigera membranacea cyanobiont' 210A]OYD94808.1 hypothetical protein CDG76_15600 [Nostoc sp. 'Peltigera membranacea cyanobiont' 210A]
MNAEESELAYRKLLSMLEDRRFGWVVEQVEAGIFAGDIELPEKRTSPTIIEDFSAHKKLRYLVDAIEQAVINTADMERETLVSLKEKLLSILIVKILKHLFQLTKLFWLQDDKKLLAHYENY